MGSSSSKNIVDNTVDVLSRVAFDAIQDSQNSGSNSINITLRSDGDTTIRNNVFRQRATINSEQLLNVMSSQSAQNDVINKLKQVAESLTSGINVGNSSRAENIIESYLNSTLSVTSNVQNLCKNYLGNSITIDVATIGNNPNAKITVEGNEFEQVGEIFSNCVADVVNAQEGINAVQNDIDQMAKATTEGINLWAIALIIFLIILVIFSPVIIVSFAAAKGITTFFQFLFPIIFLIGLVFIGVYFFHSSYVIIGSAPSRGLNNSVCGVSGARPMGDFEYPDYAADACINDPECKAMDWKKGSTTFYSEINRPDCEYQYKTENSPNPVEVSMPVMYIGSGPPTIDAKLNDMYLDNKNGDYYRRRRTDRWPTEHEGNFYVDTGKSNDGRAFFADRGGSCNFGGQNGYHIQYGVEMNKMYVYDVGQNSCSNVLNTDGDQYYISSVPRPEVPLTTDMDWSGVKAEVKNPNWLYVGITCIVAGFFGTIVVLYITMSKNKDNGKFDPTKIKK